MTRTEIKKMAKKQLLDGMQNYFCRQWNDREGEGWTEEEIEQLIKEMNTQYWRVERFFGRS